MYDALAALRVPAKEDDEFYTDDIKVITNWCEEEERR
jgi:hypothetical protein